MNICSEVDGESFVWNTAKADNNWRKHGVRFEEAVMVFFDPEFILMGARATMKRGMHQSALM